MNYESICFSCLIIYNHDSKLYDHMFYWYLLL